MGYSPASVAVPLVYTASSTMLALAWKVVSGSSSLVATGTSLRRSSKSPGPPSALSPPTAPTARSTASMELRLSTSCHACGARVSLEVPKWISDSVDMAQNSTHQICEGACHRGYEGGTGATTAGEVRKFIVDGTVGIAQAVKASPILPILFAAVKALVAFAIYLDARFLLREHAVHAATEVATGLVEIEKELGLMRNAGEGLSIGWEALVKGIIALAKSESPATNAESRSDYPGSTPNKIYPLTRLDTSDYASSSAMYRDEPTSPTYSTGHRYSSYLSTDMDESGPPTLTPPSPRGNMHLSAPEYVPPLRRTPLSSPILRTHYTQSGASTPSQYTFHEARLAPSSHDSYHPPSYATGYSDSFDVDPAAVVNHRRSRSGPDASPMSSSSSSSEGSGSWPTRTMLGWADKLLTRADSFHH